MEDQSGLCPYLVTFPYHQISEYLFFLLCAFPCVRDLLGLLAATSGAYAVVTKLYNTYVNMVCHQLS